MTSVVYLSSRSKGCSNSAPNVTFQRRVRETASAILPLTRTPSRRPGGAGSGSSSSILSELLSALLERSSAGCGIASAFAGIGAGQEVVTVVKFGAGKGRVRTAAGFDRGARELHFAVGITSSLRSRNPANGSYSRMR